MVSGSQKHKKRRDRDSAPTAGPSASTSTTPPEDPSQYGFSNDTKAIKLSSTNEEIAARVTERGYAPTFDGPESLPPSLVAYLGEGRAERLLKKVAEDAVDAFTMPGMAKEFEGHRAVVQRAYGDERACATLKEFVRANTKVVPLDIWELPPGPARRYHLGSANPLTAYYVRCHAPELRPQTSDPNLIDFGMKVYGPIKHGSAIIRMGEWFSAGMPPEAAKGRALRPEERAWSLVAIYTSPIPTPKRISVKNS